MQKSTIALQDLFLNQVRKEKVQVTVHLVNGYQIKGSVIGFDSFTVIMEADSKQMVVYKHAISTITPHKAVQVRFTQTEEPGEE
jgi:host factor-I protein